MALFEDRSLIGAIKVYRPTRSNDAKAWWRYAILAVRYQVRCTHREEIWREAGITNMNILADIRSMMEKQDFFVGENCDRETAHSLHSLEMVVDDLHRENMALRKMIKSLLTPLARESYVSEGMSIEDIENEISVFDEHARKGTHKKSPVTTRSHNTSPLKLGGEMENDMDDQLIEDLANTIGKSQLNIHSPYESFLPSIFVKDHETHDGSRAHHASKIQGKGSPQKPAHEKSLSYVEREALRRETIAKKKGQEIMKKADQLLRTSILDNEHSPSSYLPVLKTRAAQSIHVLSPSNSPSRGSGPSPTHTSLESQSPIVFHQLEQLSQTSIDTNYTNANSHRKQVPTKDSSPTHPKQPAWCDDVKIEDKEFIKGRGKGKAREPAEPITVPNKHIKQARQVAGQGSKEVRKAIKPKKIESSSDKLNINGNGNNNLDYSDTESKASLHASPRIHVDPPLLLLDEKRMSEMSDAEKLSAKAIAKARGKHRSKANAKKPLTNLEKNLLKSPLALPVMKAPVNPVPGMPTMSPRERALRSNASPRVQSFIYPQKVTHKPTVVLVGGGNGGASAGKESSLSVLEAVDIMMQAEKDGAVIKYVEFSTGSKLQETDEISVQDLVPDAQTEDQTHEHSYFEAPPDSPTLNLNSADMSTTSASASHPSAPASPQRAAISSTEKNHYSTSEGTPSQASSAEATHSSMTTTASNHTSTNTNVTNNSASTMTPTAPRRTTVSPKPSPRIASRNSTTHSVNKQTNNNTSVVSKADSTGDNANNDSLESPRSRAEQKQSVARLSLSPQRSPRLSHATVSDVNNHKLNQSKVAKRHTVATSSALTSQSAPNSSVVQKASVFDSAPVDKLNLNSHIEDTISPSFVLSSPGRHSEEDKIKKKNTLKSLNEKSNPGSPRDKFGHNSTDKDFEGLVSIVANDVDISSATVGPHSPA